jgi:hypothetical protein
MGCSQVLEKMERETGIEPATSSLGSWHSTAELLPLTFNFFYFTVPQGLNRFHGKSISSILPRTQPELRGPACSPTDSYLDSESNFGFFCAEPKREQEAPHEEALKLFTPA